MAASGYADKARRSEPDARRRIHALARVAVPEFALQRSAEGNPLSREIRAGVDNPALFPPHGVDKRDGAAGADRR